MKFSVWLEKRETMFAPGRSWKYKNKKTGLIGQVNRAHRLNSQNLKRRSAELSAREKENEL